jgi:hypothetical protein
LDTVEKFKALYYNDSEVGFHHIIVVKEYYYMIDAVFFVIHRPLFSIMSFKYIKARGGI